MQDGSDKSEAPCPFRSHSARSVTRNRAIDNSSSRTPPENTTCLSCRNSAVITLSCPPSQHFPTEQDAAAKDAFFILKEATIPDDEHYWKDRNRSLPFLKEKKPESFYSVREHPMLPAQGSPAEQSFFLQPPLQPGSAPPAGQHDRKDG
ncbi:MAG: hypothetical protein ABF665_16030 [Gluconacetobacter sp.]